MNIQWRDEFKKNRRRSIPLSIIHVLECFLRVIKGHRSRISMRSVFAWYKWRVCTQLRLVFFFVHRHNFFCRQKKIAKVLPKCENFKALWHFTSPNLMTRAQVMANTKYRYYFENTSSIWVYLRSKRTLARGRKSNCHETTSCAFAIGDSNLALLPSSASIIDSQIIIDVIEDLFWVVVV